MFFSRRKKQNEEWAKRWDPIAAKFAARMRELHFTTEEFTKACAIYASLGISVRDIAAWEARLRDARAARNISATVP
jgi:hypothetical protein